MTDTIVQNQEAVALGLHDVDGSLRVAGAMGGYAIVDPDHATSDVLGVWGAALSAPVVPTNTVAPVASEDGLDVGDTVSCTTGTWTANPPAEYSYQWQEDGGTAEWVDIDGATSATLVLTEDLVGADIRCTVTATNLAGTDSENSNELGPVLSGE